MPFKLAHPERRVNATASATSSAAQQYYAGDQAATYTTESNALIQRELTVYTLELLQVLGSFRANDDASLFTLLDLGCGSGLSTAAAAEWLGEKGTDALTIGFDISASMLSLTNGKQPDENDVRGNVLSTFYCGNAAQRFPMRPGAFNAAIGISMLQWLSNEGLQTCFSSLFKSLQTSPGAVAVFQIYPTSLEQVNAMEELAVEAGFAYAEVFITFPRSTASRKWYLALKKEPHPPAGDMTKRDASLCSFACRHFRRCAWHLLADQQGEAVGSAAALRARLGKEHVKEAWHIWRKYRRSLEFQAKLTAEDGAKPTLHAKALRSLELRPNEKAIGEALQTYFMSWMDPSKVTFNDMMERMEEVVNVMHKAFSASVAQDRAVQTPSQ
ncbi:hypothetical protein Poli38472_002475 [Pythium oligandrum]|uniref:Methyltransferase domain-containing protein n=1 Tax=Pythium oligandrum TaxID=41045 RepID=A0A8K1CH89_PYTOL|nr:hypothetical protein Poli38472_002475 [Pythium oligandrum]|eukprot:TMW63534.1 hypothetical protein Poli38472_002475 [Pythium oligandrum]